MTVHPGDHPCLPAQALRPARDKGANVGTAVIKIAADLHVLGTHYRRLVCAAAGQFGDGKPHTGEQGIQSTDQVDLVGGEKLQAVPAGRPSDRPMQELPVRVRQSQAETLFERIHLGYARSPLAESVLPDGCDRTQTHVTHAGPFLPEWTGVAELIVRRTPTSAAQRREDRPCDEGRRRNDRTSSAQPAASPAL
ncbi:hypothetical protein AB0368_08870 [Actinoplanes sp. NPDC051475]|uniref:hypothetical protein n=1 Tax=Actinoplanes sp. NPDC051475 TaxID=3157225 RepID=UPI00344C73DE